MIESNRMLCTCFFAGRFFNIRHLRYCKRATLQFCFVKIVTSIIVIILHRRNLYQEGIFCKFNPSFYYGYLYISIFYNISYTLALHGIIFFYHMTKVFLIPHDPLYKFLTVKFIMFLSYWQAFILILFVKSGGAIKSCGNFTAVTHSNGILFFILTFEMILTSILLCLAFPVKIYQNSGITNLVGDYSEENITSIVESLKEVLNPKDFIYDAFYNYSSVYRHYFNMLSNADRTYDPSNISQSSSYTNFNM
ncbi:hypothetical protein MXB_1164 [Myxobolus squamalis]|nr:hypothetical protein MXB_1164 [Myxobolus squamalis]